MQIALSLLRHSVLDRRFRHFGLTCNVFCLKILRLKVLCVSDPLQVASEVILYLLLLAELLEVTTRLGLFPLFRKLSEIITCTTLYIVANNCYGSKDLPMLPCI